LVIHGKKNGEVTFVFTLIPDAKKVYLAGTFNDWDPTARRMVKTKDGSFRAKMVLPTGEYEYKFIADGVWLNDPDAEHQVMNPFGTLNSLIRIE
jgi:1,4-alpha-glucan branching enzyme